MRKLLLLSMLLSALLLLFPASSHAQYVVTGQGCGASGLNAIANDGTPVVCRGNPLVWTAVGGTTGGGITSYSTVVDAKSQGVLASAQLIWDAGFTSGSNVVSIPNNDINFSTVQLGMIAFGTNPSTVIEAAGSVVVPQGFVCAINAGAKTITIGTSYPACAADNATANCTFNSPAFQGCVFVVGPDDTQALINAWNTTINGVGPCAGLALPIGIMLVQKGQFNANPSQLGSCRTGAGNAWQGDAVFGIGQSFTGTMLVPTPNFDFTTCTGGVDGKSCFLGSVSMYATNFAIFGAGNAMASCSTTAAATVGVEFDGGATQADVYGINLALTGWGSQCHNGNSNDFIGVETASASMVGLTNVWVTGFGMTPCKFNVSFNNNEYTSMYGGACVGGQGNSTAATQPSGLLLSANGGYVVSYGAIYGNGQNASQPGIYFSNSSSVQFYSFGDQIAQTAFLAGQANNLINLEIPAGTTAGVWLDGDLILNPGGNVGGASNAINLASGSVHIRGTNISLTGTGSTAIATASPAKVFDDGGNLAAATTAIFSGSGTLFGSNSIIGTVPVTGNFALTNATFTSVAGTDQKHFVLNVAASASSPITVVYTFPTPFWVAPGSCHIQDIGGAAVQNPILTFTTSVGPSATAVTFLSTTAATSGDNLSLAVDCQ